MAKAGKRRRRQYSEDEKSTALATLAANDGNVKKTAIELGIPHKTLDNWAKGKVLPCVVKQGNEKRGPLADALEEIAYVLVDAIPGKVSDASLQQAMTSLGIAIDKMQLLRGKPTSIDEHGFSNFSDDQLRRQIEEARARLLAGACGPGGGVPATPGVGEGPGGAEEAGGGGGPGGAEGEG